MNSSSKKNRFHRRLAWSYAITLAGVLAVLFDAIHPATLAELRALGVVLTFVGSMLQMWATWIQARRD